MYEDFSGNIYCENIQQIICDFLWLTEKIALGQHLSEKMQIYLNSWFLCGITNMFWC